MAFRLQAPSVPDFNRVALVPPVAACSDSSHGHSHGGGGGDHGHSHGGGGDHGHSHGGGGGFGGPAPAAVVPMPGDAPQPVVFGATTSLPKPNLDREFGTEDLHLSSARMGVTKDPPKYWAHVSNQLLNQGLVKQRGQLVKEATDENPEAKKDIFFNTIFGDVDGVRAVVESGVDIHQVDLSGYQPIHYAARRPNLPILKYLVSCGADVEAVSQNKIQETPLLMAVEGGDLELVHTLVSAGANINGVNAGGFTPLHYAVQRDQLLILVYLLHNHADTEFRDIYGSTPLAWAAYHTNVKMVQQLLRYNANPMATDLKGLTPLHWAAARGHVELADILMRAEPAAASVRAHGAENTTPAELARRNLFIEAALVLEEMQGRTSKTWSIANQLGLVTTREAWTYLSPYLLVPAATWLFALLPLWLGVLVLVVLLTAIVRAFGFKLSYSDRNPILMGVLLGSYTINILLYFTRILARTYMHVVPTLIFWIGNFVLVESYRQLAFSNPGFIEASRADVMSIIEDIGNGRLPTDLCPTCLLKKPERSKHCRDCDKCVSKMDHHCPWTNNCVGQKNMKQFWIFATLSPILQLVFFYLCLAYYINLPSARTTWNNSYYSIFLILYEDEPFLGVTLLWHLVNFVWITYTAFVCNYHVLFNVTTNESWNWRRYEWLKDPNTGAFYNKYDNGLVSNFLEMWYGTPSHAVGEPLRSLAASRTIEDPAEVKIV